MNKQAPIILVGGGTGGHITPLIALGEGLSLRGRPFIYVGQKEGKEEEIVSELRWPFMSITAGKWRRYLSWQAFWGNAIGLTYFIRGVAQCVKILIRTKAPIVISKGGYVALPMVIATAILRRRLLIHESDSVMGMTNRLSVRFAKKVFVGFPLSCYPNANNKFQAVGLPIRKTMLQTAESSKPAKTRPLVLIIGGIQGAKAINQLVWECLAELATLTDVVHIVGRANEDEAKNFQEGLDKKTKTHYKYFGFLKRELPYYFAMADLVICRASATTVAEAGVFSKPVLLIPLPGSAGNHQLKNAQLLQQAGAALYLDQASLSADLLVEKVREILDNQTVRVEMGKNLSNFFQSEQATEKILEEIE